MNILIAFATRFGCSEKCAKKLEEKLSNNVEVINLRNNININKNFFKYPILF
ncbi:MAG: flavodoxin domain-containing protein [Actinobacteria bacterium]|nr:flavodoxin domain-containing protein [Actinomycetota bacterium]